MVIFHKKLKKYNEIQFTKNEIDLNIRKMTNNTPSPADYLVIKCKIGVSANIVSVIDLTIILQCSHILFIVWALSPPSNLTHENLQVNPHLLSINTSLHSESDNLIS